MTTHKHLPTHEHHLDAPTKQAVYRTLCAELVKKGYDIDLTPTSLGFDLMLMRWSNDGSNKELASDTEVLSIRDLTEGIRILKALRFGSR